MRIIAVSNPKGGSGKTTVITNLAAFFTRSGYSVLVLDADSQSSATDWASARGSGLPRITVIPTSQEQLLARLHNARKTAFSRTVLLLDLPAAFPVGLELEIYPLLDAVLVPAIASPIDVRAMVRHVFELYKELFEDGKGPATGVIVNRAKVHTRIHKMVLDGFLKRIAFPLIGELRETQNYPLAAHEGKGIVEMPLRQVIKDMVQWKPILEWLTDRLYPDESFSLHVLDREISN